MMKYIAIIFSAVLASICGCTHKQPKDNHYVDKYMAGLPGNKNGLKNPYLTAGDKAYIIGLQNGTFPDMGGHVPGEMGGFWTHPIKAADGFCMSVSGNELKQADSFVNYPYGNEFIYNQMPDLKVTRLQFAPEGRRAVIVKYTFSNTSAEEKELVADFSVRFDLSPVWFSAENGIIDYPDEINWNDNKMIARDKKQPWFAVCSSSVPADFSEKPVEVLQTKGQGITGTLHSKIKVGANKSQEVYYFISASDISELDAVQTFTEVFQNHEKLLAEKKELYRNVINRAKIEIPDKALQNAYTYAKINTQWLVADLSDKGRFLGAGAIEYPWLFGTDNSYSQQGVVVSGDFDLAKQTLLALKNVSEKVNGSGQIIHEMSSNGYVYNKGNTQETSHFIVAVYKVFQWTGDIEFLKEMYPYMKKGIKWLTEDMDQNGNLFPEGYGIMEVRGLNAELIDVAVYTQQALECMAKMAVIINDPEPSANWQKRADMLKEKINTEFWDENEGSYCDFFGTKEQALKVTNGAIEQIKDESELQASAEFYKDLADKLRKLPNGTQKGFFTNKNWVISTPMETGIAPSDKAIRNLNKVRKEHCNEYGPYLSAVERNRNMTIATGVQAVAEAQNGRIDNAVEYMNMIAATLGRTLPGSMNEMMPDYGCPSQAWTIYAFALPLVSYVFGVQPDAYKKEVVIQPDMPSSWNSMSIDNVKVGDNTLSVKVERTADQLRYFITSEKPDWKITLKTADGKSIELSQCKNEIITKNN